MMKHFYDRYMYMDKILSYLALFEDERHACNTVLFEDDVGYYIASYRNWNDPKFEYDKQINDQQEEGSLISESEMDYPKTNAYAKEDAWQFFIEQITPALRRMRT